MSNSVLTKAVMFKSNSLFQGVQCPDLHNCNRANCLFSHKEIPLPPLRLPIEEPIAKPILKPSLPIPGPSHVVPAKRTTPAAQARPSIRPPIEPPRKLQK